MQTLCLCKNTIVTDMGALVNLLKQENEQTFCVFRIIYLTCFRVDGYIKNLQKKIQIGVNRWIICVLSVHNAAATLHVISQEF